MLHKQTQVPMHQSTGLLVDEGNCYASKCYAKGVLIRARKGGNYSSPLHSIVLKSIFGYQG